MNDLLSLLGLAWPRVLLYPGGLAALALAWLLRATRLVPYTTASPAALVLAGVPPLLLLSLLPLPGSVPLPRAIDLIMALALLEWPRLLALASDTQVDRFDPQFWREPFVAGYGLLLLAAVALAQGAGSLALDALVRGPLSGNAARALLAGGAFCWALALPAVLALGSFQQRVGQPTGWAACLRGAGHLALATLLWQGLLPAPLWLLLPFLLIGLWLLAAARAGKALQRPYSIALRVAAGAVVAGLVMAAGAALVARMT